MEDKKTKENGKEKKKRRKKRGKRKKVGCDHRGKKKKMEKRVGVVFLALEGFTTDENEWQGQ